MSAPTPAPGDSSPTSGYYPDPSIPGYIRYWNGAAWVPGTSRPAPAEGEPMPEPPGGHGAHAPAVPEQHVAPAEETGPMFLDEEPASATTPASGSAPDAGGATAGGAAQQSGGRPEPASAWQADASRQSGFGGTPNGGVSWGAPGVPGAQDTADPQGAAPARPEAPDGAPAQGAWPDGTVAIRAVNPHGDGPAGSAGAQQGGPGGGQPGQAGQPGEGTPGQPPADRTMMVRRLNPNADGTGQAQAPGQPQSPPAAQPEPGTMAIRALPQNDAAAPGATAPPHSGYGYPQQGNQPAPGGGYGYPQQSPPQQQPPQSPVTPGPGGGAASWPQQAQQPAPGPGPDDPVMPFKPPTTDPFLEAAQAQAAARPAPLGKRLAARLIDGVLLAVVLGAAAFPFIGKATDHIEGKIEAAKMSGVKTTVWLLDGTTAGYLGIVLAALLLFGFLYEVLPTHKWGWTLGKKLLKLEVRDIEEHAPPSFGASVKRWLVYCVPGLLAVGVIGILWCVFDRPWRQCLHDKAARTFVAG
ncbi:RDD family protein [Streptomyces sp. NPDC002851]